MTRCSCGFSTNCVDDFCAHIANGWEDVRGEHSIK